MFLGICDCFDCEAPDNILERVASFTKLCYDHNNDGVYTREAIDFLLPSNIGLDVLHATHDKRSVFAYNPNAVSALRLQDDFTFRVNPIYVHPNAQGQGIGIYIMKFWERVAKELGGKKIVVQSSLFKRTLDFYHKLGYQDTRRKISVLKPGLFFGVQHMEKIL